MSKEIRLADGTSSLVSDEDYALVSRFSWHLQSKGYAAGSIGGGYVMMHRFIVGAKGAEVVNHINGNPLDNRRENLQITNSSANNQARNCMKRFPFIGVQLSTSGKRYKAEIKYGGRKKRLGTFDDPVLAAQAYDSAALEIYGEHALTNVKFLQKLLAKLLFGN